MRLFSRLRVFFIVVAAAVALDQATKAWARANLSLYDSVDAIPGLFDFTLVYNDGAAFGMLKGSMAVFVFIAVAVVTLVLIYLIFSNRMNAFETFTLSLVCAGAIGNSIDRLVDSGRVTDFIEPVFMDFAVFNVADICVTIGCIAFALGVLVPAIRGPREGEACEEGEEACDESEKIRDGRDDFSRGE